MRLRKLGITIIAACIITSGCSYLPKKSETPKEESAVVQDVSYLTTREIREHKLRKEKAHVYKAFLEENGVEGVSEMPYDILQQEVYNLLPKTEEGSLEDLEVRYNVTVYEDTGTYYENTPILEYIEALPSDIEDEIEPFTPGVHKVEGKVYVITDSEGHKVYQTLEEWEVNYRANKGSSIETKDS